MEKQEALEQLEQIRDRQEKRMEYYLNLIKNGEELTPIEICNAKKHLRLYGKTLETSKALKQMYSFDLPFQDIDHATYSVMNGSRLVPCPECINAITELLKND